MTSGRPQRPGPRRPTGAGLGGPPAPAPREDADAADYSPITAQRKPIMMKKPENIAIRASPP